MRRALMAAAVVLACAMTRAEAMQVWRLRSAPVVPAPPPSGLLTQSDFTYVGGFRFPNVGSNGYTFQNARDGGMAYDATSGHLYVSDGYGLCTINIPAPVNTSDTGLMNEADWQQPCIDPSQGNLYTDLGARGTGALIGGVLVDPSYAYVSGYGYYWDPGLVNQVSHWRRNRTISVNDYAGLQRVWNPVTPTDSQAWVSVYMFKVPAAWQAVLGGTAIAGGCCIPIVSRTSQGPSFVSFDYQRIYVDTPPHPGTLLAGNSLTGFSNGADPVYNATTEIHGCAIIDNTKTLVCGGRHGAGGTNPICYGIGADCGDPEEGASGWHAYPYRHQLWLFNLDHLAEVKAGSRASTAVVPYESFEISFPLSPQKHSSTGLTYDPASKKLYFSEGHAHNAGGGAMIPVVQVFTVNAP